MSDEIPEEGQFGLVMPFVVVKSKDGPYDDDAYVAGYEAGRLDARLEALPAGPVMWMIETPFRTDNVPQLDLIAMQHGFKMENLSEDTEDWQFPEWTMVSFRRDAELAGPAGVEDDDD